jgi:NAD(P) transhydrogenase subunit beta
MEISLSAIGFAHLLAAGLFVLGLRFLSSPTTARRGNMLAAIAMLIAIVATFLDRQIVDFTSILLAIAIGTIIGAFSARLVKMTSMPQMVAIFNGFGGGASALVALAEFQRLSFQAQLPLPVTVTTLLSVLIGAVTFSGSMVAFGKLQGLMHGAPITSRLQKWLNIFLLLVVLVLMFLIIGSAPSHALFVILTVVALIFGVALVIPVGGADMPVVISLLNSFSGLAACATGFVVGNNILMFAGALVGAAGLILTQIMCKAMNRSLARIFIPRQAIQAEKALHDASGGVSESSAAKSDNKPQIDPLAAAVQTLSAAKSVIFVPGYGMALAQAQFKVVELANLLEKKGATVNFAVHPIAGRMPGHMHVLLAEAEVDYDKLREMDSINPEFKNTDAVIVVGACDVINPSATEVENTPISGMPILAARDAKSIIVCNYDDKPGYSGVENPIYQDAKTICLWGDAKDTISQLITSFSA